MIKALEALMKRLEEEYTKTFQPASGEHLNNIAKQHGLSFPPGTSDDVKRQTIKNSFVNFVPMKFNQLREEPTTCLHDWKLYNGFNDSFTYCAKCDVKKPSYEA